MALRILVLVVGLVAGVYGYGYWHSASHATLTVLLSDSSRKERDGRVLNAELVFLDASSKPIARGRTDHKLGLVLLRHPASNYCSPDIAPEAFRACVLAQSEWIMGWVNDLRFVSVVLGNCRIERIPIEVTANRDNLWTWWIALARSSGIPYTHFGARIDVDSKVCTVTSRRA
jgi:hypothetical protein